MIVLAEKIGLSDEAVRDLEALAAAQSRDIKKFSDRCRSRGFHCLRGKAPLFRLAVILTLADEVKAEYDRLGIDERIYYDTMSDIKIWCDKAGGRGLKNYAWLKNHVSLELFRLGRLQFQFYECKNKTLLYSKLPFSFGDRLIYVHIPEGEPLDKEKCEASFVCAEFFFKQYFPDYEYSYYFCESWLLFEGNREFMAKDSNIVKFMSLFTNAYNISLDHQAIERIFGKRCIFKANYPENTSLQKRVKEYMLKGNKPGIGVGYKERDRK